MKNLNELFDHALKQHGNEMVFYDKGSNKTVIKTTFAELYEQAENLALGLMDLGLKAKDKVGLIADNRSEWTLADMAVIMNGAIDVPRGTDSTPQEVEYILKHSDAKIAIFENEKTLKNLNKILSKTKVKQIVILDRSFKSRKRNVHNIEELIERGQAMRAKKLSALKKRSKAIKKDDLFTIIYTSGTTGNPKGVMLSHQNMIYNTTVVPGMIGLKTGDVTLSILPIWHVFERAVNYAIIRFGAVIHYTNIRDLRDDFQRVQPTFMVSAPRLWENIYMGVKNKMENASGIQKGLFNAAFVCKTHFKRGLDILKGNRIAEAKANPLKSGLDGLVAVFKIILTAIPVVLFEPIIFKKLRGALGGRLEGTISGGGALPPHVDEFFNVIGIPIYEGYGMTECAPIISVRTVGNVVQRTVGFTPEGTEVKILNDSGAELPTGQIGIVHVKGPQVMQGYYKNKAETSKVLNKGWLNTGDLGFISFNKPGALAIRGRAKDTIVLLGGENLEPVPIENLLLEDDLIDQIMVVGQDRKTLGALIWPSYAKLKDAGFNVTEGEDLNNNAEVRKLYMNIIKSTISSDNGFKSFEKVSGFKFLPKAMEVGDELTNLYKMKRNVISKKYEKLIDSIYL